MAEAVLRGASHRDVEGVETRMLECLRAKVSDLLWAEALILGTPENFGMLAGAMKDFFDRTFYPAAGRVEGLPYTAFVKGGNDGTGALRDMRRIVKGYPFRECQPPIVCGGVLTTEVLEQCEDLGTRMALGLALGMY